MGHPGVATAVADSALCLLVGTRLSVTPLVLSFYPPPPGASDVIGMECSGTVSALGEGVTGWAVGAREPVESAPRPIR